MSSSLWAENDNRRHLRVGKIRNIPHGTHAIAIEFAEDYCHCGASYSANGDRNFYFDVLGVNAQADRYKPTYHSEQNPEIPDRLLQSKYGQQPQSRVSRTQPPNRDGLALRQSL